MITEPIDWYTAGIEWQPEAGDEYWPGVYAIFRSGRLEYVGESTQVARRLATHRDALGWRIAGLEPDVLVARTWTPQDAKLVEQFLIGTFKPPQNRKVPDEWIDWGAVGGLIWREKIVRSHEFVTAKQSTRECYGWGGWTSSACGSSSKGEGSVVLPSVEIVQGGERSGEPGKLHVSERGAR